MRQSHDRRQFQLATPLKPIELYFQD